MVNRLIIVLLIVGGAISLFAGITVWISCQPQQAATQPLSSADTARQKRVQEFFGGRREYDLEGGQEMRPRW